MDVASYLLGKKSAGGGGGSSEHIQYDTMPTASADTVGKIVQYVGATDNTYTNGYFYIGVSDGAEPATYSWENVAVQDGKNCVFLDYYYNTGLYQQDAQKIIDKFYANKNIIELYLIQPITSISYYPYGINRVAISRALSTQYTQYILTFYTLYAPYNSSSDRYIRMSSAPYRVIVSWDTGKPIVTSVRSDGTHPTTYFYGVDNNRSWTPTTNYSPASKKYVDDAVASAGGGLDEDAVRTLIQNAGAVELNEEILDAIKEKYGTTNVKLAQIFIEYPSMIYKFKLSADYTINIAGGVTMVNNDLIFNYYNMNVIVFHNNFANEKQIRFYYFDNNFDSFNANSNYSSGGAIAGSSISKYLIKHTNLNLNRIFNDSNGNILSTYSNETIAGTYTFNTLPQSSVTPTNNNHFTNKAYVDGLPTTYTGYDATKTQVLKNINGVLTWVDE